MVGLLLFNDVGEGEGMFICNGLTSGSLANWHSELPLDPPKFDLDPYIANYTGMVPDAYTFHFSALIMFSGRTRFDRLFLIGTCSSYLSIDALKAAVAEAKSGIDISRYERAVQALFDIAPSESDAHLDQEWVERTKRVIKAQTDRLEHELKASKNNLIKESIRVCHHPLSLYCFPEI